MIKKEDCSYLSSSFAINNLLFPKIYTTTCLYYEPIFTIFKIEKNFDSKIEKTEIWGQKFSIENNFPMAGKSFSVVY